MYLFFFRNVLIYAKQKIKLTWPDLNFLHLVVSSRDQINQNFHHHKNFASQANFAAHRSRQIFQV